MRNQTSAAVFRPVRRDRLPPMALTDSYKNRGKLAESTTCSRCGAVYHEGRWQWLAKAMLGNFTICPACKRVQDQFPAGYVVLSGKFFAKHEAEIMRLIHRRETLEKAQHPLQRIMDVKKTTEGMLVTTTDIHLARGIGEAVHRAYQGNVDYRYNLDENLLRVSWRRER